MDFKKKIKKIYKSAGFWLIVLFLLILIARLVLVFQNPYFNYEVYFDLRQAEHVMTTGLPLYDDPLSYGGKIHLFAPLYYYLLAFFGFIFSLETAAKILPNVLASLLVFLVYALSLKLTKHPHISFITAFFSATIPILFFNMNGTGLNYLALLLVLGVIYCIFRINERKYVDYALILMFFLVLTTPLAFVLMIGLLFYLMLSKTENIEIEMKELELILFFTFLVFWLNLLIYKRAFLQHGFFVIWQNTPISMLSNFFSQLTFIETFIAISIIPMILGLYAIYSALYLQKNKNTLLLLGFALATFVLLWFKLITFVMGLIFLSTALVILSSFALKRLDVFIDKSKLKNQKKTFLTLLMVIFVITALIPSFLFAVNRENQTPTSKDIAALNWASKNTPETSTFVSTVEEGSLVQYYAKRKTVMDSDFLLVKNIDKRSNDLDKIYTTKFETEAIASLNGFQANYIFFSQYASQKYGVEELIYTSDKDCFLEAYSFYSKIYYLGCKLKSK